MKRFPFHILLSLVLILPLAACDSDGDDDDNGNGNGQVGNASVTVSGDISSTFSGNAFFFIDDDENLDFSIGLFSGAITTPTAGQIVGLSRDGDRPATGTYTIDAEGDATVFQGGYANFEGTAGDITGATFVAAETGTLTITSSSNSRVVGTFTFTGQVLTGTGDTGGTATVAGSFTAELVEDGNVPIFP